MQIQMHLAEYVGQVILAKVKVVPKPPSVAAPVAVAVATKCAGCHVSTSSQMTHSTKSKSMPKKVAQRQCNGFNHELFSF